MQWKEKGREGRACARVLLLPPPTTPATTNLPCSMDLRRQALDFGFAPNPSWAQSVFWADYNQSCFLPSHCDSSHHKETNERACNICAHTTRIQKSGAVLAESRIYVCAHTSRMQYTTRIQKSGIGIFTPIQAQAASVALSLNMNEGYFINALTSPQYENPKL